MKWLQRRKRERTPLSEDGRAKNKRLAEDAAMYAMFASGTQPQSSSMGLNGKGGGFDISNAQKVAAYNLLMNDRD